MLHVPLLFSRYTDEKNAYIYFLKYAMSQMQPKKNDVKVERVLEGKAEV